MAVDFVALKLAETFVSQAIERITDLLIDEALSLRGVSDDIRSLQTELKWIASFLRDADKKQERDERVRIWISEVRDIACEIEDVVETYVYKIRSSRFNPVRRWKLRAQINSIKDKLRSIGERRQRYQIEFSSGDQELTPLEKQRRSFPDEEEDDVITLKSTMAALKDQLMRNEDRSFVVVSIVGMGGLGKTTPAKKAYNYVDVKKRFTCYAWVFISQQCVVREVLIGILMQVGFQSNKPKTGLEEMKYTKEFVEERRSQREILKGLEDHELVALMKSELNEKRYLIILDDIWSLDAWNSIKKAFPRGKQGSKVVFTTRIKEVALCADPHSTPIEPPFLTNQESWELLQKKAFHREIFGERGCPPELEGIGKEMVAECGGLPLAIVVLGGLLRTKSSLDEWVKVKKDVTLRMINKVKSEKQYRVENILDLSFQELPCYLKPCFLYLGSFPEDSEIPKGRLIRLWIDEQFIRTTEKEDVDGTSIEDVSEQWLEELVNRCMVQVDKNDCTGKGIKSCRLHDLMRDFCISKAKEEDFFEIMQQHEVNPAKASSSSVQHPRLRRIAIHGNQGLDQRASDLPTQVHHRLRSLLWFSIHELPSFSTARNDFQLLKVLQLDFLDRAILPDGIGFLIHLRSLRVSGKGDDFKVPRSIKKLRNLQTLDLAGIQGYVETLSRSIWKLEQLRHLTLPLYKSHSLSCWARKRFFRGYSRIKLVTLKGVNAKDLIQQNSVLPMPNIKVLGICNVSSGEEINLVLEYLFSQSQLEHVRSLNMAMGMSLMDPRTSFPKMELLSHCQNLTKLKLCGMVSVENLSFLPKSLSKLFLRSSVLNQSKIEILETLSSLRVLQLGYESMTYRTGKRWLFSVNGFPKLEILELLFIERLYKLDIEEGAMSNLKRLDITCLEGLKMIPEGLKYVTTLRELNIKMMSKEFVRRLKIVNGIEGPDFHKVRHIPTITFANTMR